MLCLYLVLLPVLVLLGFVSRSVLASVLAIDYGTEWTKASLMKPGVPFDVLLNKDSKRKIQSSVGWKRNDRLFGSDAFNLAARFPTDSFSSLKFLQGVPFDSETVSYYQSISTADIVKTPRGTVALKRPDGTEWSVEELIAMQFAYVKELAEAVAGEKVQDVIVTVPAYYTQFERDAVVDAIEIAGLRTVALINDGTATAVNYAMTRTFPTTEHHVIYDAGASGIRATVVSFAAGTGEKNSPKDSTQITVLGVGYDRTNGGTELNRRLRDILVADFQTKHKRDITGDKRGMAKLWKEAERVKTILSANAEAMATVESVAFDIDYRSKVTRVKFEEACADLKEHFEAPIHEALVRSGLTLDNVTSIIMTGGSSRVPMIQNAVKAAFGEDKLAWNVNADEATVLGAALHGASLSRQFKTKDIRVSDISAFDVQISYEAESKGKAAGAKPRTIHTAVFPAGSRTGTRKTLTFKRKEELGLRVGYKWLPAAGFSTELLEVDVTGVADAIANLTEMGAVEPVVKVTAALSESGFVSIPEAVAYGEVKDESLTGKLKGLFSGGGGGSGEQVPLNTDGEGDAFEKTVEERKEKAAATGPQTIELSVKTRFPTFAPMSSAEKRKARDKLAEVEYEEKAKQRKEEARNMLESYLYRIRDLLEDTGNAESPFMRCSKEEERNRIEEKLQEAFVWLQEKAEEAETSQLVAKRTELEKLERPIVHRYTEIEEFPKALNNSQMWNWSTRMFLTEAKQNLTAEEQGGPQSKYTKGELEGLEKTLIDHETWLNEKVEAQKGRQYNENPAVESREMRERAKVLEDHLGRLVRRKVPLKKKSASTTSSSSATASSSESAGSASGSQGSPRPSESAHDEL